MKILTRHARKRLTQRGIKAESISCLEKFGREEKTQCGLTRIDLPRRQAKQVIRDLKKTIRTIEHAAGVTVLVDKNKIVTGYRNKR